jgi:hypothetical protein
MGCLAKNEPHCEIYCSSEFVAEVMIHPVFVWCDACACVCVCVCVCVCERVDGCVYKINYFRTGKILSIMNAVTANSSYTKIMKDNRISV